MSWLPNAVPVTIRNRSPARLTLVVGVLDVVVGGVDLGRAGQGIRLAAVLTAETADVHLPQVEARLAVHDPLRHLPAHAAGAGQAVSAEAGGHPEAGHVGFAQYELAVRREGLRAVEQLAHLRALHRRHAFDRVTEQLVEPLP